MKTTKLLSGWYRVSGEFHFSNVKRTCNGLWLIDLRVRSSGDLVEEGSLWTTKRNAIEEAERIITRWDRLHIPQEVA